MHMSVYNVTATPIRRLGAPEAILRYSLLSLNASQALATVSNGMREQGIDPLIYSLSATKRD